METGDVVTAGDLLVQVEREEAENRLAQARMRLRPISITARWIESIWVRRPTAAELM